DLLRYTVSPLLGWLQMPLLKRGMFSPAPVPARFQAEYAPGLALRPSQIRATSQDGALMIPGALALRDSYRHLTLPVVIIAGDGDKVVFVQRAEQLRDAIPGAVLQVVEGAGHMVHHCAPSLVAKAVQRVGASSQAPTGGTDATEPLPDRSPESVGPEHEDPVAAAS
ncbi:MAG: alpha/beta hydrolase, partial [Proteobacteria bacterium]|nr:alpha/beta hydrolase [Pseudomonadota bacterium]